MICLICGENAHNYLYKLNGISLWQCPGCGLISSYPHATAEEIVSIYGSDQDPINAWTEGKTESEASERYLEALTKRTVAACRILVIAPPAHCFSSLARDRGLDVVRHLTIREFEQATNLDQNLDAIIFIYQIDKSYSPKQVLDKAYELMKPGGLLLLTTPSLDSIPAQILNNSWTDWRPENNYYLDRATVQSLLLRYGFSEIEIDGDLRLYTLEHMFDRVASFPKTWVTQAVRIAYHLLPTSLHKFFIRLPTSGIIVSAKKTEQRKQPLLSIILPVYNECSTFSHLMNQLIDKKIQGLDKEIIIVESNSTDNSRQLVLDYKENPEVKIILQEKARGKGNAVREGFDHARGDIILIQDADLEYDLNDYDALLDPIVNFKKSFVLGARHGGKWKMRHFDDQQQLSAYFNFGHVLFTFLVNFLYGQKMKDPFTMFKVFRRDCLHNLYFECNRFDFDFELVIKLIRKGYVPLEIPVNYDSRSFKEGKKVNMFRDPFTWVKASFKYRFAKITKD